jgi:hypothetical protein
MATQAICTHGRFGGFEVNFLPGYIALHEAGFNVLAYNIRNHGLSGSGNGGLVGIGLFKYCDVIGCLRFARARPDLQNMKITLLSICLGCNATIVAMSKHPKEFDGVSAMLALQPVSARPFIERASEGAGIENGLELFDAASRKRTGFGVDKLSPIKYAKSVTVPTLVAQVREDETTKASDVQTIYDAISAADKKLSWIEGIQRRFDGYNYFSKRLELMIEWSDSHFGQS